MLCMFIGYCCLFPIVTSLFPGEQSIEFWNNFSQEKYIWLTDSFPTDELMLKFTRHNINYFNVTDLRNAVWTNNIDGSKYLWESMEVFLKFYSEFNEEWKEMEKNRIISYISIKQAELSGLKQKFENTTFLLNSYVFVVYQDSASLTMHEIYSSALEYGENIIIREACRSKSNRSLCDPMSNIWERRQDLSKIHLRAVMQPMAPYGFYDNSSEELSYEESMTGMFPEIFLEVRKLLKFTFNMTPSVDGTWGSKKPNATGFTGIMGMLERNEADIVTTFVALDPDRMVVMDASMTIVEDGSRLFVKSSDSMDLNTVDLLLIFYLNSWLWLGVMVIVLIVAKFYVFMTERRLLSTREKGYSVSSNAIDAFAVVTRAMLLMGYGVVSKTKSGKLLLLTIMCLGIVTFTYIRAGILSKLAVKRQRFEVNSLEDVLNSDFQLGTMAGGSSQKYFERSPKDTLQKQLWYAKMKPEYNDVMITDTAKGLEAVFTRDKYTYSIYNNIGRTSKLVPCKVTGVGPVYNMKKVVFAFRKNSALTDMFNYFLMRLRENGALAKIIEKWTGRTRVPDCTWTLENRLGFETLFGIFGLLLLGMALAVAISLWEQLSNILDLQQSKTKLKTQNITQPALGSNYFELLKVIEKSEFNEIEMELLISKMKTKRKYT